MQNGVVPRAFLGVTEHISDVNFSETRGNTSQLRAIPENLYILEYFGVSRLASQMHFPTWSNIFLQTLKNLHSIIECPYRFNGSIISLGVTLYIHKYVHICLIYLCIYPQKPKSLGYIVAIPTMANLKPSNCFVAYQILY